jgi:hypothetical protein
MEAYQAVYASQELTEEQVWEEVENWVNSLVDEGYDLSEYTWEEAYEAYNYIQQTQLNENPAVSALTGMATRAISPLIVGGATKLLQSLRGGKSKQEPVDYGQGTYFSSSKDKPAPKPSWEKPSAAPSGRTSRLPSPSQPPVKKPTEEQKAAAKAAAEKQLAATRAKAAAQPPVPKPPAQPPAPKPPKPPESPKPPAKPPAQPKPAASLGLRKAAGDIASAVGRASTSGPGKTALKYGVGVPVVGGVVGGLATGAAIDVKRALTGQSSASQRLSGALQGGAGNVLKTVANVGAAIPGVKDTGTPQEIQQTGEYLKKAGKDTQKKVDVKRYVELNQSADLLDIVKNYLIDNNYSNNEESALSIIENMSDEWIENILEGPELGSANAQGKIYTGPKYGYQSWQTASSKRLLPSEALGSEPPKARPVSPAPKPEPQRGSTNAQGKFYTGKQYGYQSWQTASAKRLLPSEVLGSEPPKARAATQPEPQRLPVQPAPAPAATTQRPTQTQRPAEPKVSPSKPAQTGDRTKDLTTWALANKTMIDKVGTKSQREILTKAQAGETMSAPRPLKASYEYDAYDLVLEYLLSQGHTDTVEEAHYVMMEMDAEMIGTIVEAAADQSDKQIDKGVKTTYKAQNVLDNQHQGRSKGLNKLPRGEREEKAKRMQGRLKARRDDLFGERNKREDSKREQLKKMLGL